MPRNLLLALLTTLALAFPAHAADLFVYFGTQDKSPGTGFSLGHFNTDTGQLSPPHLILAADAPSYFFIHPDGKHLYSTNFSGAGGISSYAIDPTTGGLTLINRIPGNNSGTSYLGFDQTAHFALAANFDSGHLAVFPILPDASLGPHTAFLLHSGSSVNPQRQTKTYPHCIITDPTNRYAFSSDLGLDKLFIYHFNPATGSLADNDPPFVTVKPGSGPRHIRFHPNGKWLYLVNEMGSLIYAYAWDPAKGALTELQSISTIPEGFTGENNAAELEVYSSGKFLYASNRGHDSIAAFAIDPATGKLSLIGHFPTQGKNPRNFTIDPTAHWLLATNQSGNSAIVFAIDQSTGKLTQTGDPVPIPAPCCERFYQPPLTSPGAAAAPAPPP